jgi:hypothetical protein
VESRVPEHLIEGLVNYATDHLRVGGFLQAVLANDLFLAVQRADAKSLASLPAIVNYVRNYLPFPCQGSAAKVHEWLYWTRLEI